MDLNEVAQKRIAMPREERSAFENTMASVMQDCAPHRMNDALLWVWLAARDYRPDTAEKITSKTARRMQTGNHSAAADGQMLIAAMKGPVPQEAFDALARLLLAAGLGIPYPKQNEGTPPG